jgi:hypothetical protein
MKLAALEGEPTSASDGRHPQPFMEAEVLLANIGSG